MHLGIAALVAVGSYLAMSLALRIARSAIKRLSSNGSREIFSAFGEILAGTSQRLMLLTALLIGI
ncbi:MAG: mechanosensitive ion channel family protein, partial [Lautropia sp.]